METHRYGSGSYSFRIRQRITALSTPFVLGKFIRCHGFCADVENRRSITESLRDRVAIDSMASNKSINEHFAASSERHPHSSSFVLFYSDSIANRLAAE